jgi:capsule polysaccharide modification protein KpsS
MLRPFEEQHVTARRDGISTSTTFPTLASYFLETAPEIPHSAAQPAYSLHI